MERIQHLKRFVYFLPPFAASLSLTNLLSTIVVVNVMRDRWSVVWRLFSLVSSRPEHGPAKLNKDVDVEELAAAALADFADPDASSHSPPPQPVPSSGKKALPASNPWEVVCFLFFVH